MTEEKKDSNFNLETFLLFILVFLAAAVLIVLIALFNQSNFPQNGKGWQGNATATLLKLPPTWTPVPSAAPISVSNRLTRCLLNTVEMPFYMEYSDEHSGQIDLPQIGAQQAFIRTFRTKAGEGDVARPISISQIVAELESLQAAKTGLDYLISLGTEDLLASEILEERSIPTNADDVKLMVGLAKDNNTTYIYNIDLVFRQGKVVNNLFVVVPFKKDDPNNAELMLNQVNSLEGYAQKIADRCE